MNDDDNRAIPAPIAKWDYAILDSQRCRKLGSLHEERAMEDAQACSSKHAVKSKVCVHETVKVIGG